MAKRSTAPTKRRGVSKSSTAKRKRAAPATHNVVVIDIDWGPIEPNETAKLEHDISTCKTPAERIAMLAEATARTLEIVSFFCRDLSTSTASSERIATANECIGSRLRDLLLCGRALWREIMNNPSTVDLMERGGFRVGNKRGKQSTACVATALAAADTLYGGWLKIAPDRELFDGFEQASLSLEPARVRESLEGLDVGDLVAAIRAEMRGALDSLHMRRLVEKAARAGTKQKASVRIAWLLLDPGEWIESQEDIAARVKCDVHTVRAAIGRRTGHSKVETHNGRRRIVLTEKGREWAESITRQP